MNFRLYVEKKDEYGFFASRLIKDIVCMNPDFSEELCKVVCMIEISTDNQNADEYLMEIIRNDITQNVYKKLSFSGIAFAVRKKVGAFDSRSKELEICLHIKGVEAYVKTSLVYIFKDKVSPENEAAIAEYLNFEHENADIRVFDENSILEYSCFDETVYRHSDEDVILEQFNKALYSELEEYIKQYNLKMDTEDIMFVQNYFLSESRSPSVGELKIIDCFFSENCRHTTFRTILDEIISNDPAVMESFRKFSEMRPDKNPTLENIAKAVFEYYYEQNQFPGVKRITEKLYGIEAGEVNGDKIYLTVKNESSSRSVTTEPYHGAQRCVGGTFRDVLCGLGYVYDCIRVGVHPKNSETDTAFTKSKKETEKSAKGFSDYAASFGIPVSHNIELTSGINSQVRFEICSALAAVNQSGIELLNERKPENGDSIFIFGNNTGRDGQVFYDTSGKSGKSDINGQPIPHGDGFELAKIQRLFIKEDFMKSAVAVNDIGSGGILVAVTELADGVTVNLDKVPVKYDGLSLLELSLSESEGRFVAVVKKGREQHFVKMCEDEGLSCAKIATVNDTNRLTINYNNKKIASVSVEFLYSGGAEKRMIAEIEKGVSPHSKTLDIARQPMGSMNALKKIFSHAKKPDFVSAMKHLISEKFICKNIRKNTFDATLGASYVFNPFEDFVKSASVQKTRYREDYSMYGEDYICSVVSVGIKPEIFENDPYRGAYLSVTDAVMGQVASGYGLSECYLSVQKVFSEHKNDPKRLGVAVAAVLGAFEAQNTFGVASVGGGISISSELDEGNQSAYAVFAVSTGKCKNAITADIKKSGNRIVVLKPIISKATGLPEVNSQRQLIEDANSLIEQGHVYSAVPLTAKSVAEGALTLCAGTQFGFEFDVDCTAEDMFDYCYGGIVLEVSPDCELPKAAVSVGTVIQEKVIKYSDDVVETERVFQEFPRENISDDIPEEACLRINICDFKPMTSTIENGENQVVRFSYVTPDYAESDDLDADDVASGNAMSDKSDSDNVKSSASGSVPGKSRSAKNPKVILLVVDGSVGETDAIRAIKLAGADHEAVFACGTHSIEQLSEKLVGCDMLYICDGYNCSDFLSSILSSVEVSAALASMRERGGVIFGVGAGFEALIKSGLLDLDENKIGIHKNPSGHMFNGFVKIRISSDKALFTAKSGVGEVYDSVISGYKLRLSGDHEYIRELAAEGRIAAQYVRDDGFPSMDPAINPALSDFAIDAVMSKDGSVWGQISHFDRISEDGNYLSHRFFPIIENVIKSLRI